MTDLEQQLRTTLNEKGDTALDPPPEAPPDSLRRRIRRRQAATVAMTGITASVIIAGSAVTIAQVIPHRPPLRPVAPPPKGTTPSFDELGRPGEMVTVSIGSHRGEEWRLQLSRQRGVWCLGVATPNGGSSSCPVGASDLVVASGESARFKYVYGTVSSRVTSLKASTVDGDPVELSVAESAPILPPSLSPEQPSLLAFRAPFRVFVGATDRGRLVIVTAHDRDGEVIRSVGA